MGHVLPPAGLSRGHPVSAAGIALCGPRHLSSFDPHTLTGQRLHVSARPPCRCARLASPLRYVLYTRTHTRTCFRTDAHTRTHTHKHTNSRVCTWEHMHTWEWVPEHKFSLPGVFKNEINSDWFRRLGSCVPWIGLSPRLADLS